MRLVSAMTVAVMASAVIASGVPAALADPAPQGQEQEGGAARLVGVTDLDERQSDIEVYSPSMDRNITLRVLRSADTSEPRPTLYVLSGVDGGTLGNSWMEKSDIVEFFSDKDVNVVIPVGGESSYYADWKNDDPELGRNKWTTFMTQELPPVVDETYATTGINGLIGFSMSGTSSLNMAIAAPGLYSAVGSFSGCAQTSDPVGQAFVTTTVVNFFGNPVNMWGPYDDPAWVANDPYVNAEKLRGTALYLSTRTGLPGRYENFESPWVEDTSDLARIVLKGGAIEAATALCTRRMAARLDELGIPATVDIHENGTHSWGYWQDDLHASWPVIGGAIGAL